ncbi:alkaline phosphatase family protein [Rhodococcus sp. G-MC3]|uniref:alkaline phosphatase family protein n=1 Tax=Rhodococcus sp. G-MC3 TaxID=3046209 RepID=UPI0024BB48FD|nr:alkaline phosphatase family protein [Rhodococcus sp. G-MC3]MDJ0396107.1 alkaline phosphatase family protein [Rhodococcus sp. G-MC3]
MLLSPRYGSGSLADVVPSVLSYLGVQTETDRLDLNLDGVRRVCVLMIDGLGADQLAAHPDDAPFMTAQASSPITAGFPSTTATSLSSLGTGLPPGEHGIVGYLVSLPNHKRLMNSLQWKLQGSSNAEELPLDLTPERFQPLPTAFEHARDAGIRMVHIGPSMQNGSGLTRASLRGAAFRNSISSADLAAETIHALSDAGPALTYSYYGDLDLVGHVRGPNAPAWRLQLQHVDALVEKIASRLPADGALVVVADHGMVEIEQRIDYDTTPELRAGLRQLGGEPRMRYLYTRQGATADVHDTWLQLLEGRFTVVTRDDAIERGWFGPRVTEDAYGRIGDLLAVANDCSALIRSQAESNASKLIGHHGSLTSAELLVPAIVVRPRR